MRHLSYQDYFQRIGLPVILLAVGLLGGLLAPNASEAAKPIVTLVIDGVKHNLPVGDTGSCALLTGEGAYNACYAIIPEKVSGVDKRYGAASGDGSYRVSGFNSPTPRLLIGDLASGDNFKLSNIQIAPYDSAGATSWTKTHTIYLWVDHVYDAASPSLTCSKDSSGTVLVNTCNPVYSLIEKIGGQFYTPGITTATGNFVRYEGFIYYTPNQGSRPTNTDGTPTTAYAVPTDTQLDTVSIVKKVLQSSTTCTSVASSYYSTNPSSKADLTDINTCALRRTLGTSSPGTVSFSGSGTAPLLEQTLSTTVNCYTGVSGTTLACKPRVLQRIIVKMIGGDTFQMTTSAGSCGGSCTIDNNKGGQDPQGPPCFSSSKKVASLQNQCAVLFDRQESEETDSDLALGATYPPACTDPEICGCQDPVSCKGMIVIEMAASPNVAGLTFPFIGDGPEIPATFPVGPTLSNGVGKKEFMDLSIIGGDRTFTADLANFPPIPQEGFDGTWKIDSISCKSKLNEYVYNSSGQIIYEQSKIFSQWETDTGSSKLWAKVTQLGGGDIVTCSFHGHKNSSTK